MIVTELLKLLSHVVVADGLFMGPHQLQSFHLQSCYLTFLLQQFLIQCRLNSNNNTIIRQ